MRTNHENSWPSELTTNQRAFLEVYSRCGRVKTAAQDICHRACHYRWMRESPLYREWFGVAKAMRGDDILSRAQELALDGCQEPVVARGFLVYDREGKPVTRTRFDRGIIRHLIQLLQDPAEQTQKATNSDTFAQNSHNDDAA